MEKLNSLQQDSTKEVLLKPVARTRRTALKTQSRTTPNYQENSLFEWSQTDPYFAKIDTSIIQTLLKPEVAPSSTSQTQINKKKLVRVGSAFRGYRIGRWISQQFQKYPRPSQSHILNIKRVQLEQFQQEMNLAKKRKHFQTKNQLESHNQISRQLIFLTKYREYIANGTNLLLAGVIQRPMLSLDDQATQPINKLKSFSVVKFLYQSLNTNHSELQLSQLKRVSHQKISGVKPKQRSCQICFSNKRNSINQLKTCKQCNCRFHLNCFKCLNSQKLICQTCQERSSNTEGDCFFCSVQGLPTKQCFYRGQIIEYHPSCLILAGKAQYNRGAIQPVTEEQTANQQDFLVCDICNVDKGFTVACKFCPKNYHPLCAFFSRVSLSVQRQTGMNLAVTIRCCRSEQNQSLLTLQLLQQGLGFLE